ncbi:MAG: glycosyltransferase family 2 protein [Dermatophilaceae bacterium]|jgi:glycosyltransferase involved in cell wall biosynthesis|nr:glycosyltransferase family 2 protein [Actinomycetales bacterium]MBP9919234.1 glycosyltransferase family 2 protein [Dermatophilaceae bacterium]
MPDTVFLIPAYNESSAIVEVIHNIPEEFDVVCVDDGSKDDTAAVINGTRAQLVRHCINLGQGAALQTAIDYALQDEDYDYFVTFDADGQHRIEDVRSMIDVMKSRDVDIVLGSRFLDDTSNVPALKRAILKLAVRFSNTTSGLHLTDTHNGLRVMNRHAAESMKLRMPDFSHASEIVTRIQELNLKYEEIPVTIIYSDYSRSKGQSVLNAINIAFDVIFNKVVGP